MSTTTRNEVAARQCPERCLGMSGHAGVHQTSDYPQALAAERRATVERIRAALLDIGDEDGFTTTGRVRRILDEEAAR